MNDPYQVLGVSRGASDEEIKKAYRALSRRYHPDANVNKSPREQQAAEEKFKDVQQAYDLIMKEKQTGYSGSYGEGSSYRSSGSYGNSYGYNSRAGYTEEDARLQAAVNYIRNHAYSEALHVLNDIPFAERKGRWYYYSAVANAGMGDNEAANEQIDQALGFEPSNIEYRQFKNQLNFGTGQWYSARSHSYGNGRYWGAGAGAGWCISMLLLNLFCNMFGWCGRPF